ncbi:MAG: hypothetical protein QXO54_01405 [Candidatus Methanomethylicaceae archaeon]|nr:hypothetical protein [Candidatus Verstraetearchaeota archaeon]
MRLAYSAFLAVLIGVVLVSSPLLLTGLSPTDLRIKVIKPETAPDNQKAILNNDSSYRATENETYPPKTSIAADVQYSLNGVFISLSLGIVAATLSYLVIRLEVVGRFK